MGFDKTEPALYRLRARTAMKVAYTSDAIAVFVCLFLTTIIPAFHDIPKNVSVSLQGI